MRHDGSAGRGPGRPRTGSEDKRERILREAFSLFARLGYTGTSLADVAREAEISKAGLLHHFGSKEALFSAVLERRDREDLGRLRDVEDVWAFLDGWVALVESNAGKPGMVGLYTAMAVGALDAGHPGHPWLHDHFEQAVEALAGALERGKQQGAVAPDAPSLSSRAASSPCRTASRSSGSARAPMHSTMARCRRGGA